MYKLCMPGWCPVVASPVKRLHEVALQLCSMKTLFSAMGDEREIVRQLNACVRGEQPRSGRGCTPRWILRVGLRRMQIRAQQP